MKQKEMLVKNSIAGDKPMQSADFKIGVSVDCVIFGFENNTLKVLLIRSDMQPYRSHWSLLGDIVKPDEDIDRTTASVSHVLPMTGENHFLTSTFVWGYNDSGPDHKENSFTLESNLQLDRFALYGKYENIEKSAEELALDQFEERQTFNINAITLGVNYTILRQLKTNFAIGAQGSIYMADASLDPIYGNSPMSAEIYMRISPTLMNMNMGKMKMK